VASGLLAGFSTRLRRRAGRRRLAVLDTHFPWRLSGFRFHEFDEIRRQRPDTVFFSLFEMGEPFDAEVHPIADFPRLAPELGITDAYLVFLNFALGTLGLTGHPDATECAGWRDDISLWPTLRENRIRAHVTLYPGGGLLPGTPPALLRSVAARAATIFTNVAEVEAAIPEAVFSYATTATEFYRYRTRPVDPTCTLIFAADDRPRKGLSTLIEAYNLLDDGFNLHIVGPHERHLGHLTNSRYQAHGWLSPDALRELYWQSDAFVSPVTTDAIDGSDGDPGMVDGFPTATAADAVSAGCALVSCNPRGDDRILRPDIDYLLIPENDVPALVQALQRMRNDPAFRQTLGRNGSERIGAMSGVQMGVAEKRSIMGLARAKR
jgi:hypothetical protein